MDKLFEEYLSTRTVKEATKDGYRKKLIILYNRITNTFRFTFSR